MTKPDIENRFNTAHEKLSRARRKIGKVIFGQDAVIDRVLTTLISGGHVLLIGVPGLAKTLLVDTTARVMGLDTNRIQCTPDLMPADVLGSEVLDENENGKRAFRFIKGPIFTQFLMADEINRASPRTQSALLQAMQERQVTVSGTHYDLPKPFHVLATQNPIEQEGTYPLPEAQLDRFLMQIDVGYPSREAEKEMLMATTGNETPKIEPVLSAAELIEIQELVRAMPIGESVVEGILNLVRRARPGKDAPGIVNEFVEWPPGPRAAQALMLAARARALIDGRTAPSMDDVITLAPACLKHRMALNYKARAEGVDIQTIIAKITAGL
jgi:MoxR-like ATPase